VEALSTLLSVFRTIQRVQEGTPSDAAIAQAIGSLKVEQHKERAVLTANIPIELLRQLATPSAQVQNRSAVP
jgi:hypothetical protein